MTNDPLSEAAKQIDEQLTDLSPMPFGKYKGTPMQDVPASYLHWLWVNGKKELPNDLVGSYIRRSMSALRQEYPNGIWH